MERDGIIMLGSFEFAKHWHAYVVLRGDIERSLTVYPDVCLCIFNKQFDIINWIVIEGSWLLR